MAPINAARKLVRAQSESLCANDAEIGRALALGW